MGGKCSTLMGYEKYIPSFCEGKTTGKTGHRWKGNIKMGLTERGLVGLDCTHLAQGRIREQ